MEQLQQESSRRNRLEDDAWLQTTMAALRVTIHIPQHQIRIDGSKVGTIRWRRRLRVQLQVCCLSLSKHIARSQPQSSRMILESGVCATVYMGSRLGDVSSLILNTVARRLGLQLQLQVNDGQPELVSTPRVLCSS